MTAARAVLRLAHGFDTSAERVFDAWLAPATLCRWMCTESPDRVVRVETDPRPGGGFTTVERRDGGEVEVVGRYVELDRPRRLVVDLAVPQLSPEWDRVTVELAPAAARCELHLVHENLMPEYVAPVEESWRAMFARLAVALAESTGER